MTGDCGEGKIFNKPEIAPLEDPGNYVYQVPGIDAHGKSLSRGGWDDRGLQGGKIVQQT